MKIQKFALYSLVSAGMLMSCQKELKPQDSSSDVSQDSIVSVPNPDQIQSIQPDGAPVSAGTAPTMMQSQAPVQQQTTQTAPGMNPPHGQPGHICEIPVGAPLSSAPKKSASPTTTQQVQTVQAPTEAKAATFQKVNMDGTPAGPVQEVNTAPGMNPPHGQPGHVCEIPVGSPLPQ